LNTDLLGFRLLNQMLTLLAAHPENEGDMLKVLDSLGLKNLYINKEWPKIHTQLLENYKSILGKLDKLLGP